MVRVIIDSCVFGDAWFKRILSDLEKDKRVRFTFANHPKMLGELERAKKLGKFYQIMADQGRRDDVSSETAEKHISRLQAVSEWRAAQACDDPHIFAMVYAKPTKFVFTAERRLAKCRTCMNRVVDGRYCRFRVVRNTHVYRVHRAAIHA